MGEPSRVMEEELCDIHVVSETPLVVEPITAVPLAKEEYELESNPEEQEDTVDSEPIEELEEVPHDGTTFEDELLGEYADRIIKLGDRIQELEQEVHGRHKASIQLGAMIHHLLARNVELVGKLEQLEQRVGSPQMEKETLRAQLEEEIANHVQIEEQWDDVIESVGDLEDEVRKKRRKMNRIGYTFRTAIRR